MKCPASFRRGIKDQEVQMQDLHEIEKELMYFFRNKDILSVSTREVTTQTDTGTYASDSTDTLDTSPTTFKNIRSITVGGSPLSYIIDYSVNHDTGVITYTSPQTGAYTISYDTGPDRIFSDFPQRNLKLSDFPRMAIEVIGGNMTEIAIAATTSRHTYNITVVCYAETKEELEDMIKDVQSNILSNKTAFYNLGIIHPATLGPILNSPRKEDKILQRNIDFFSDFNFETV